MDIDDQKSCCICRALKPTECFGTYALPARGRLFTVAERACTTCFMTDPARGMRGRCIEFVKSVIDMLPPDDELWASAPRISPTGPYAKRPHISDGELEGMMRAAGDCCEICATPFSDTVKHRIDHCHQTGMIRGLLCHSCNVGLGFFRDNPRALHSATIYLERSAP